MFTMFLKPRLQRSLYASPVAQRYILPRSPQELKEPMPGLLSSRAFSFLRPCSHHFPSQIHRGNGSVSFMFTTPGSPLQKKEHRINQAFTNKNSAKSMFTENRTGYHRINQNQVSPLGPYQALPPHGWTPSIDQQAPRLDEDLHDLHWLIHIHPCRPGMGWLVNHMVCI